MAAPRKIEVAIPSNTTIAQEIQEDICAELEKRNYTSRDVFGVRSVSYTHLTLPTKA